MSDTYDLYLCLPDAYTSLADDPRFAVRFANKDIWDAALGMNRLSASVIITGGQEPPANEAIDNTSAEVLNGQVFDLLGRSVDDSYQGIVIQNGNKLIR